MLTKNFKTVAMLPGAEKHLSREMNPPEVGMRLLEVRKENNPEYETIMEESHKLLKERISDMVKTHVISGVTDENSELGKPGIQCLGPVYTHSMRLIENLFTFGMLAIWSEE